MASTWQFSTADIFGVTALNQEAASVHYLGNYGWDRLCHAMAFNFERSCGDQETGSCSCDLGTGVSGVWELPRGRGEDQAANTAAIHDS